MIKDHKNALTEKFQGPGVLNIFEKLQGCKKPKEVLKAIRARVTKEVVVRGCSRGQNTLKDTWHSQPAKAWLGEFCLHMLQAQQTDHHLYPLRVTYLLWIAALDWTQKFVPFELSFLNTHIAGRCFCRVQILPWRRKTLESHGLWFSPQNNWAPHFSAILSQLGLPEEAMIGKYLCRPRAMQFRARPPTLNRCVRLTATFLARSQVRTNFPQWGEQGYWQALRKSHKRTLFLIHMAWLLGSKLLVCAGMKSAFNQVTKASFLLFKNSSLVMNYNDSLRALFR